MENNTAIQIVKDLPNKKVNIRREFDAPADLIWRAWTESTLLDQWWAPKPWMTKTKSMQIKAGGNWFYAMAGPDGTEHWNRVEFTAIKDNKSFEASSSFTDDNGNHIPDLPTMHWKNVFIPKGSGTTVEVEISFTKKQTCNKSLRWDSRPDSLLHLGILKYY